MSKTKKEIQEMASFICNQRKQYLFSKVEICEITGLCRNTVVAICKDIPPASTGRSNLYYIQDILNAMYNK